MTAQSHDNILPMHSKMTISFVAVTPEVAERWLDGNTSNRTVRIAAVNQYATDMVAGRWTPNNDAICFAPDGTLLNGQHRLHAVVRSGKTVTFAVMRNITREAMANMDTGRKRTAGDYLGLEGEKSANLLASTVKLALLWTDGRLYQDRVKQGCSTSQLSSFLDDTPGLRPAVDVAMRYRAGIDLTPTVLAVAFWKFSLTTDGVVAIRFFESLSTLAGLPAGSPILALDSRLKQVRRHRQRLSHREELHLIVKTWNHWRGGKSVKTIALPRVGDQIPEPK